MAKTEATQRSKQDVNLVVSGESNRWQHFIYQVDFNAATELNNRCHCSLIGGMIARFGGEWESKQ